MNDQKTNSQQTIEIPEFNLFQFFTDTDQFKLFQWEINIYNWVYYVLIYVFLVYIYNKVFRTRKLPIIKNMIVYLIMAVGAFMLLIFQVDAGLPIVLSLGIAIALMLIVRIRYFMEARRARKMNKDHPIKDIPKED